MATYKPVSERAKALHGEEPFEADLSPVEERDALDGGHLQIVPRPYRVLVNNYEAGKQDSTVSLALTVENEAGLIAGGILARADKPKK